MGIEKIENLLYNEDGKEFGITNEKEKDDPKTYIRELDNCTNQIKIYNRRIENIEKVEFNEQELSFELGELQKLETLIGEHTNRIVYFNGIRKKKGYTENGKIISVKEKKFLHILALMKTNQSLYGVDKNIEDAKESIEDVRAKENKVLEALGDYTYI